MWKNRFACAACTPQLPKGIPQSLSREDIARVAWAVSGPVHVGRYRALGTDCDTEYQKATAKMAESVAVQLSVSGEFNAKPYSGFSLLGSQTVQEALKQAQDDGVKKLLVVNQDVVFSNTSTGVVFDQVRSYVKQQGSAWGAKVIGVRSFARDPKFINHLIARMEARLSKRFADKDNADICLLVTGPAFAQFQAGGGGGVKNPSAADALYLAQKLQDHFKANYDTRIGFASDQYDADGVHTHFLQPADVHSAHEIAQAGCKNVYIFGGAFTTVPNLQSLFHEAIVLRGSILRVAPEKDVFVEDIALGTADLTKYLSDLLGEVTEGKGDIDFIQ